MIRKTCLCIGLLFSIFAIAQPKWQLVKEKNGIKVFTANQPETKVKMVMVDATIMGEEETLIKILLDADATKRWAYGAKTSSLIKNNSSNEIISYLLTSFPWPANDRDVVLKTTITKRNNLIVVDCNNQDNIVPEKSNIVRIPMFKNSWEIIPLGNGYLRIKYILKVDPGGSLPGWLVNIFITKGPIETFSNLEKLLKSYQ